MTVYVTKNFFPMLHRKYSVKMPRNVQSHGLQFFFFFSFILIRKSQQQHFIKKKIVIILQKEEDYQEKGMM